MLHRSSLSRPIALIAALAGSALAAASAHAAMPPAPVPVPADAPTVATTPSGDAVIAFVVGGRTCTVFQEAGAPRPATVVDGESAAARRGDGQENGACQAIRAQSRFHAQALHSRGDGQSRVAWGVAGPGVARLRLQDGSRVVSESAAAPAALPGLSGDLRFWALEQPNRPPADEVAVLDAAGTVRNAYAPLLLSLDAFSAPDEAGAPSVEVLAHGTVRDARWRLFVQSQSRLTPTPLDPEHRVPVRCLGFATEGRRGGSSDSDLCDRDVLDYTPLVVTEGSNCELGLHFEVLAGASVRSAIAVLGDGSRRRIRLLGLGGTYGARAGVLIVGAGIAVRRIDGLGADGRVVDTWAARTPPYRPDCGLSSSSSVIFADPTATPTLGAPPHVVHVADRGDGLCVAVDRAPRLPTECAVPPTDPESAGIGTATAADGSTFLYGIVPTEIAAARVRLADGTTRTVATTPIPGYAGQYAGVLGQITLDLPSGAGARSAVLLDAAGRVIGRSSLGTLQLRKGPTTRLRPSSGGLPSLLATPFTAIAGDRRETGTCVSFTAPKTLFGCGLDFFGADDTGARTVRVFSRCSPRRLVVLAVLRRASDRLVVRTRAGHEVVARTVRLPSTAGGHHLAVAVLGPHDAIAGVLLRGPAARRLEAAYPAAASQCGFDDQPGFDGVAGG